MRESTPSEFATESERLAGVCGPHWGKIANSPEEIHPTHGSRLSSHSNAPSVRYRIM